MTVCTSKAVVEFSHCPLAQPHFPTILRAGRVLIGLEFRVVVWEFVEEDGYWQTVEDNSKSDADESKETAKDGLRVDVSVAHSGDADLQVNDGRAVSVDEGKT